MTNIQENLGPEPNKEDFTLVSDPSVRNKINAQLEYITAREFLTPYVGLEAVRKILAYSSIFIPNTVFLEKTSGYDIFDADQFGEKLGMNNDGEVVTAPPCEYKIYFEWQLNSDGQYDIFCSIVSDDELEELLADGEEDEEDEDEEEEMNEEKKPPFEGPYSKTVAPKTEKKKHNEVAKLARRAIKKVKKKLEEDYPGVQRRSNKTLDPDLQKKFKDYKSDQQAKHSSNMVKMSYQNSPNQTFKTMGQTMPWKSTDSRAKYDATRDKVVDTQNQREIRRDPPITVKEEQQLNELHGKSREAIKKIKARLEKKHDDEWEATKEKRKEKKSAGPNDTRDEDKSRNNLAKRWLRADKAEKKLKEDYDHKAKEDHDETKNIASGARRKSDKKRWKSFVDYNNKRAVTGMEGKHEGKKLKESKDATKDVSKMLASKGKTLVRNKSGLAVLRKIKKK